MAIAKVSDNGFISPLVGGPSREGGAQPSHPMENIANANTSRVLEVLSRYRNAASDRPTNPPEGASPSDKEEKSCQPMSKKPVP